MIHCVVLPLYVFGLGIWLAVGWLALEEHAKLKVHSRGDFLIDAAIVIGISAFWPISILFYVRWRLSGCPR